MATISILFALTFALPSLFANAQFTPPEGVCQFSLSRYTGGWYELATSANVSATLERDCMCSVAYYTLNATDDNVLDATNSCIKKGDGSFYSVTGNVFSSSLGKPPGELHAVIDQTIPDNATAYDYQDQPSNYIVVKLWKDRFLDVRYSLVGGNSTNMWWLLSRDPNWNEIVWNSAQHLLQGYGYNITNWTRTAQPCVFLGEHGNNLIPPNQTM